MSQTRTTPKEVCSLIARLTAFAEDPGCLTMDEKRELIEDADAIVNELRQRIASWVLI